MKTKKQIYSKITLLLSLLLVVTIGVVKEHFQKMSFWQPIHHPQMFISMGLVVD